MQFQALDVMGVTQAAAFRCDGSDQFLGSSALDE